MTTKVCINRDNVVAEKDDIPIVTDLKVAASYNWIDDRLATILVPGIPPVWMPPTEPKALALDTGPRFIDQNADRNPGSPMEALIVAVKTVDDAFDLNKVDIITDRRPLRKLLGFLEPKFEKRGLANIARRAFKFYVEILGKTALFTR